MRYGSFTFIKIATSEKRGGNTRWRVKHDCGLMTVARASHVRNERIKCRCELRPVDKPLSPMKSTLNAGGFK